jgi:hypothetical protein
MHLAQLNIARLQAPMDDPSMADFVAELPRINAIADATPGFVWRLVGDGTDDATGLRPYGPDMLVNMSVWTSVEALREYVYRSSHLDVLRRRREWFSHDGLDNHLVLWWIPAGHVPTVDEAKERLELLRQHGPGPDAFTLREPFPPRATIDECPSGSTSFTRPAPTSPQR